jgi:4-hydroxy-tetrahydrodipicolinate synthase
MAKERIFSGVIAPVLTPFGEDGNPDAERFTEHAQWLLETGCTALAPFGTTSEANSLGLDERMEMLEELVDAGIDPARLMPGTGTCALSDTIVLTRHALDLGCGGVLMLPPFYYKGPSEDGLYRYFSQVIEGVDDDNLKVYLYHIPPVAQVGFSLPLIGRLRKAFPDTVVGLKDSSGDWSNTAAILAEHPQMEIFPGSEVFLLEGLKHGAAGCISATCNVNAAAIRQVCDQWQTADAEKRQAGITAIRQAIQAYPMIPALKAIIAHYRDDRGWAEVRPPFMPLPAPDAMKLVGTLADTHGFRISFEAAQEKAD